MEFSRVRTQARRRRTWDSTCCPRELRLLFLRTLGGALQTVSRRPYGCFHGLAAGGGVEKEARAAGPLSHRGRPPLVENSLGCAAARQLPSSNTPCESRYVLLGGSSWRAGAGRSATTVLHMAAAVLVFRGREASLYICWRLATDGHKTIWSITSVRFDFDSVRFDGPPPSPE